MVGDAALRKIVGAYALGTVAAAYQAFACRGRLGVLLLNLRVLDARREHAHRLCLVLVLRAAVLAFNHYPGRQVGEAHRRIGFVDVLAARTGGAERVDAQVGGIEHHIVDIVNFRHHCDGARRSMHATLRLGGRHALYPMRAGFEFQNRICALSDDARDDLLVAAHLAWAFRNHFHLPALALGESCIHAEQISCKQSRFVSAGSGANLQEHTALVVGVLGQQLLLQFAFQLCQCCFTLPDLGFGKFAHFGVASHFLRRFDVSLAVLVGLKKIHHRLEFGTFPVQLAERFHVFGGFFGAQQLVDFKQALAQLSELCGNTGLHSAGDYSSVLR